jgi:c-di-GMP-binding flagellar brake protein YcgR
MTKISENFFQKIDSEKTILKALHVALTEKKYLLVWAKQQAIKFDSRILKMAPTNSVFHIQFPVTITPGEFDAQFKKLKATELLGNFEIEQNQFFFGAKFISRSKDDLSKEIVLEIPKEIYKLQRRAALRVEISPLAASKVTIEFASRNIAEVKFKLIDISAGGLAIEVPESKSDLFEKGTGLSKIQLKIKGQEITATGKVTHSSKISKKTPATFKVGIQFKTLKSEDEKHLVHLALEESRQRFSVFSS